VGQAARDGVVEVERATGDDIAGPCKEDRLGGGSAMRRRDRPAVGRINPALIAALERSMHGNECTAFEDLDLVGKDMDVEDAPARRIRDAVEIAPDADQALVRDAPFELEDGPIRRQGQRLQERLLVGKGLVDDTLCGGMEPRIGDRVEPVTELPVQVIKVAE